MLTQLSLYLGRLDSSFILCQIHDLSPTLSVCRAGSLYLPEVATQGAQVKFDSSVVQPYPARM